MRIFGYELVKLGKCKVLWITAALMILGCLALCYVMMPGDTASSQTQGSQDGWHYEMEDGVPVLVVDDFEQQRLDWDSYRESYGIFIDEMAARVEKMSSTSLYGDKNSFAYRNLVKTQLDYASFAGIELRYDSESGIRGYNDFHSSILFALAFLAVLMFYVLYEERGQNLLLLLKGTRNGHGALAGAKLGAMLTAATLYVLIQEMGILIYFQRAYGFGDLTRTVQSVSIFRNCVLHITVGEALFRTVLIRIGVSWVLAAFLYLVGTLIRSEAAAVICAGGILTAEYFLSELLNAGSSFCALKFINPFYTWKMSGALAEYQNINVFSFPVGKGTAMLAVGIFVAVACAAAGIICFCLRYQVKSTSRFNQIVLWVRKRLSGLFHTVSLVWYELYKLLFGQKKVIALILLVAWGCSEASNVTEVQAFADADDAAYQYYMNQLSGPVTDETMAWLDGEQQRMEDLRQQLQDLAASDASEYEMMYMSMTIGREIELYEGGLNRVLDQLNWLKALPGDLKGKYLVNEMALKNLWYDRDLDTRLWLIGCLIAVFLVSGIRTGDEKRGMTRLLRATKNGRERLDRTRHGVAIVLTLSAFFMAELRILLLYRRAGAFQVLGQQMCWFQDGIFSSAQTIGMALLIVLLLKALSFLAVCFMSEGLARFTGSATVTLLVGAGIVVAVTFAMLAFHADITTLVLGLLY